MENIDATSITFIRSIIAVSVISLIVLSKNKFKELKLVHPWKTLFVGLFQGLSILLYFLALKNTTVANATFLIYTAPIFSLIFAKLFLKEKIQKESIIGVILAVMGVLFLLDPRTLDFNSAATIGSVFALVSGMLYSAMAITAKPISKEKSGYYLAFWQYLVITLAFIPFISFSTTAVMSNLYPLLYIGIFGTGIAFILFMTGVKLVPGQKVFIVTSLEPLVAMIMAILILSEIPTAFTLIGGLFILSGVYIITKHRKD